MLPISRASRSLIARRAALREPHHLSTLTLASRRTYVQPSGADRASVVDVPSAFQDESHFTPRTGESFRLVPPPAQESDLFFPDMLGFKLELPQREDGATKKTRPIYLDMQVIEAVSFMMQLTDYAKATTPIDPRVLDAMLPYLTDQYGNPHSRTHAYGWEAEKGVEDARQVRYRPFTLHISYSYEYCQHIADLIGADPKDIIFTSGATEANNMAIKGIARFHKEKKRHVITTQTVSLVLFVLVRTLLIPIQEHKCVLDSCRKLQEEGFDVTYLPVQRNGVIDLEELQNAIRPDTSLISVMTVNNETGVIQPIKEIGAIARKHRGVYFHTDAAQAAGKIPLDVNAMNVDLMSISGHKLYGPKGIGAAYVRRRPRVRLEPILSGGGQERGLRSGTLPTALAVGIGEAARIAKQEMEVSALS